MGIGIAASLPWKDIIVALPGVAQTATDMWKKWKSNPEAPPVDQQDTPEQQLAVVIERLQALENSEAAQAKLVKEMADQLQAISAGLTEVSKRSNIALWAALAALAMSTAALVVLVVR
jgi:hypothetical protein